MSGHPRPLVAVDVAAFTVLDADLKLLTIRRGLPPAAWALPGGFVRCGSSAEDQGEDLEDAARRELVEETALPASTTVPLVQVGVFGAPDRDPRARVVSVAWLAVVAPEAAAFVRAGGDAAGVSWWSVGELDRRPLAFDHAAIVARALGRLRRDVDDSDDAPRLARALVPRTFTVGELRAALEAVHARRLDAANFRRTFQRLLDDGVVHEAAGKRVTATRPARVYSFRDDPRGEVTPAAGARPPA